GERRSCLIGSTYAPELFCDFRRGHRSPRVIALDLVATASAEITVFIRRFHAFGDDGQAQSVRQRNDGLYDSRVVAVRRDVANEGAIDLERIHGETLQIGKARIPGAEVVDGRTHAQSAQLFQGLD